MLVQQHTLYYQLKIEKLVIVEQQQKRLIET